MQRLVAVVLSLFMSTALFAAANPTSPFHHLPTLKKPARYLPVPSAPTVKANSYIVIDAQSGKVLAKKNPEERKAPASLTKMMTLYIISEALTSGRIRMDDQITVSKNAWRSGAGGSKMFIRAGQKVSVRELIKGIIVVSGNDACVAMAEYIAGSEEAFAGLMNQEAASLGMKNTHFTDSTGMPDPDHYTTAADLAILARALITHFPAYYKDWYSDKWFTFNKIKQPNRNRLLWRTDYVDGIKTGHTESAGYCLVASGKQHGMRLISVVLGSPSDSARTVASQALLAYGFRFYETHKLYNAGQSLRQARTWMGEQKYTYMGLAEDVYVTTPTGQYKELQAAIATTKTLKAPIEKGQILGELSLTLLGKEIGKYPLLALENNAKGGFFARMKDYLTLTMHHLLHIDDEVKQA